MYASRSKSVYILSLMQISKSN